MIIVYVSDCINIIHLHFVFLYGKQYIIHVFLYYDVNNINFKLLQNYKMVIKYQYVFLLNYKSI